MLPSELRILRVFGMPAAEVSAILRAARADGCPGLRLLERDGEFAVCVQVSAPTQSMAEEYCNKWVQKLRSHFGDCVYGTGEISLAQATLDALLAKRRLLVAADEQTGRLLGALLRPLDHSEAAFDFGTQTYANIANSSKIAVPESILKKFPGDVVQASAARAQLAMVAGGADYGVAYMPATVGQAPFVMVCDKRSATALAISPDMGDAAITNSLLDLARRRTLGLRMPTAAISFRPGRERPLLIFSQRLQVDSKKGDTTRFSLRRRGTAKKNPTSDYEPMLDFDADVSGTAVTAEPAEQSGKSSVEPTVKRQWPVMPDTAAQAQYGSAGEPQPDTMDAVASVATETPRTAPKNIAATVTAGVAGAIAADTAATAAEAAANSRPRHTGTFHPATRRAEPLQKSAPAPEQEPISTPVSMPIPQPESSSLLDGDIPDFTQTLDPNAIAAANAADEKSGPRSAEELQRAATLLFNTDEGKKTKGKKAMPAKKAEKTDTSHVPPVRRSLEIIEKRERSRRRKSVVGALLVLLLLAAVAAGIFWLSRKDLGVKPAPANYGTAGYDTLADKYMTSAAKREEGICGYLGFPGAEGQLIFTDVTKGPAFATPSGLGSATPTNTVIDCGGTALAALGQLAAVQANSGFTLYLPGKSYRYKVTDVYYIDKAQSENAFDPANFTDLSSYYRYLDFVLGTGIRSLYDTGVDTGNTASFLTLTSSSETPGVDICVTGRLIGESESAQLNPTAITEAETPLLTAAQYAANGQTQPDVATLLAKRVAAYNAAGSTVQQEDSATTDTTGANQSSLVTQIAALSQETQALLTSTDELMAGLTDVAGNSDAAEAEITQGAEGSLPENTVAVETVAAATPQPTATAAPVEAPTAAPTATPTVAPTEAPKATPTVTPTAAPISEALEQTVAEPTSTPPATPTQAPTPEPTAEPMPEPSAEPTAEPEAQAAAPAEGETLNVNMNGTDQTLELVQCLAMIAQNELGPNAPAEAYKAQCVAAHCWIISQSGYPAVLGVTPGSAALAAAQEVAHVLITYNGNVCFTPYFASASTGTASAAEVWGNDRPWLQAVDSPYDQTVGSNWNTNGNNTGCARFSRQTLQDRILEEMGIDLSGVDPNSWFTILSANQFGWVSQVQIGPNEGGNDTCSGRWFRENLLAGQSVDGRSLRSQCFTVTYNAELDCFIFDVYGYGHGCGMSQWGAIGYANNGWDYASILTHYFPGTTLTTY